MILFVTTADTEILALSRVASALPDGFPTLKAVNPTRLPHDLVPATLAAGASLVLVRLLGGRRAWEAGFDGLAAYCRRAGIPFLAWSGEPHVDAELTAASTASAAIVGEAFAYLSVAWTTSSSYCASSPIPY
jgi:cobaltochelatase CobN